MARNLTRNHEHYRRALGRLPLGVASNFRFWGEERTIYVKEGRGARVTDLDGNVYVDYRMGYGPAILGYAELMQEGFYEPLGQKSLEALTRIRSNGKHLLGLINTVLDIAKIESGQFTLNMSEYAIETVVETVRSATESLAQNKKLALKT